MARNKLVDLRDHLFETIEALKDTDAPMDLARAKTIALVAHEITETAKVEVNLLNAVGGSAPGSEFFESRSRPAQIAGADAPSDRARPRHEPMPLRRIAAAAGTRDAG